MRRAPMGPRGTRSRSPRRRSSPPAPCGGSPRSPVLGEVSGFRGPNARSGHCYFQIKDESSALECIVWKGTYDKRAFDLRDGLQVLFTGTFDVYKPTGKMSFKASSFTLAGEGMLRQQVAQLAEKLRREGLMEPERKRRIPVFCTRVAVVTSLSGAVINDVKRTLHRRNKMVEVICVGAKVQGEGAPAELIEGLRRAAAISPAPDCILLVRGGGSFEDLMTVQRRAPCPRRRPRAPFPWSPGIGHEPDNSICDMVGPQVLDAHGRRGVGRPRVLRARLHVGYARATPAALPGLDGHRPRAEMDGRPGGEDGARDRFPARSPRSRGRGVRLRPCLVDPTNVLDRRCAELALTTDRFVAACERSQDRFAASLGLLGPRLAASTSGFAAKRHDLDLAASHLRAQGPRLLNGPKAGLGRDAAALDALSPLKVLGRGYSIAYDGDGRVATRARSFAAGDELRVSMADGDVRDGRGRGAGRGMTGPCR